MNALLVFVLAVSAAHASVIAGPAVVAGPSEALLKGPAAQSTVVGPDGSSISAAADSGAVAASSAVAGPVVAGPVVAGPVVGGPVVAPAVIGAPEVVASRALIGGHGIIGAVDPWGIGRAGIIAPGIVNPWGRSVWW
ncbi:hypothetical protein FQR65_LT02451 [Abscondita terminalis]|nr:hypothetical protein FQR65_LT02451 [Abscondita terminalis]